ncbi:DUF1638 domain-containing protein [Chloroflexota bacterium]
MDHQRPYLICCGILQKEVERLIEGNKLPVEPVFLEARLHVDFGELGKYLNQVIKECSKDSSRGVIVVYGDLCHPKMKEIIGNYDNVAKVNALNCIDCLLGGHGKLLDIDPNYDYFYLSPGWMPSNSKWNLLFKPVFYGTSTEEIKQRFSKLKGILLLDSLEDLDKFNDEIEKFSNHTGLPILDKKDVGLERFKELILETIRQL